MRLKGETALLGRVIGGRDDLWRRRRQPSESNFLSLHSLEPPLAETIATYCGDLDILLTEGFKRSSMPKIEVHRRECSDKLLCRDEEHDPTLIAVASDRPLTVDVPVYDINDSVGLCDLIVKKFLTVS
jgi:molybdopterin-guanine dinucleotide biosynthesis protein MobB